MDNTSEARPIASRVTGHLVMQWRVDESGALACRWVPSDGCASVIDLRPAPSPADWTLAS